MASVALAAEKYVAFEFHISPVQHSAKLDKIYG